MKIEAVKAVAYEIPSGADDKTWALSRWAEPSEFSLTAGVWARPKPTPKARVRRVRIIREADYLALLKTLRRLSEKEAR